MDYEFRSAPIGLKNMKHAVEHVQEIGEALDAIAPGADEALYTEKVWAAARDRGHALHRYVEWNKDKAAKAHQLDQVRTIIRLVAVRSTAPANDQSQRVYFSVRSGDGVAYRRTTEIVNNRELQYTLLLTVERDLLAIEKRSLAAAWLCQKVRALRLEVVEVVDTLRPEPKDETG
jgi:hypothetical protein